MQGHVQEMRGEVERITFRNDENGWTVLRVMPAGASEPVTAVGSFSRVVPGEQMQFFGSWAKHPSFGPQFKVDRFVALRPTTQDGIIRYLSSGQIKGLGEKTALKIARHFGEQTIAILEASPEKLKAVPKLGRKKAKDLVDAFRAQQKSDELLMFLNTHGIRPSLAPQIRKLYGDGAMDVLMKDPYRLATDIRGVGFLTADGIARKMGIPPESLERIRAAVLHILNQAEDGGHAYLTDEQLTARLADVLTLGRQVLEPRLVDVINSLIRSGFVTKEKSGDGGFRYFQTELMICEVNIASILRRLAMSPLALDEDRVDRWLTRYGETTGSQLSEEQRLAVRQAAASRVFVLTGGPGVGKTTTANALIRLLKAIGKSVALCAPTGRAAQRLSEVSGMEAKTIHRTLEWIPPLGRFSRDESNPLSAQVVVVDEASMLDLRLADALVRALGDGAQIIFIGDVDQLPSVGPGAVLRHLLESDVIPSCRLHRIFRQAAASQIIQTAHGINAGEYPTPPGPPLMRQTGNDCYFVEADSAEETKSAIKRLVHEVIPREFGLHPIRDIQVLTPMNRGDLGTQTLNLELQDLLNPRTPETRDQRVGQVHFRVGDKVIQQVNNYELNVFNGDIGFVQDAGVEGGKVLVSIQGRTVPYEGESLSELRHAFAITIHKSQGSEFSCVVIPASMQHFVMLQRNLYYTALTRARKLAVFVGSLKALHLAIRTVDSTKRQSLLVERIRES